MMRTILNSSQGRVKRFSVGRGPGKTWHFIRTDFSAVFRTRKRPACPINQHSEPAAVQKTVADQGRPEIGNTNNKGNEHPQEGRQQGNTKDGAGDGNRTHGSSLGS